MRIEAKNRRLYWVSELANLSGSFGLDSTKMIEELQKEIEQDREALLDHLRFCGAIPENYGHDSSEEKLYSKYTDAVINEAFSAMGLNSVVINARADTADVQARAKSFSLVADAKAFRLSRTAKNQKDFKIQAMDGWRNGLDYALVVCPIYQLPKRVSQIYQQAITRDVCILSYSHLAALVSLANYTEPMQGQSGLNEILKSVSVMHPSKSAVDYWTRINQTLIDSLGTHSDLWKIEKIASEEFLVLVKKESVEYLTLERNRLLGLSHKDALAELVKLTGVESRIRYVEQIQHGPLLGD